MDRNSKICIVGAGISGVTTAYYLEQKGFGEASKWIELQP